MRADLECVPLPGDSSVMRNRARHTVPWVNLVLGLVWAALALAAFVLPLVNPDVRALRIGGTGLNAGWLAVLFAVYNLVRWLSLRLAAQRRRLLEEMEERRYRARRNPGAETEPDPAFDFRDRPPGEASGPG